MSALADEPFSLEGFSGKARLFPLPDLVLFPCVMQPLHIFEPRYCSLMEDALADDRLIAMSILIPGWEADYEGRPPLYPVACLGRITIHHQLDDGTYNLLLMGLRRVRLGREFEPVHSYREAEVEVCEELKLPEQAAVHNDLLRRLRQAFLKIAPKMPDVQEQLGQLLVGETSLAMLTDVIGYMLDLDVRKKQALLAEINVQRRAELLLQHLHTAMTDTTPSGSPSFVFPPQFSTN